MNSYKTTLLAAATALSLSTTTAWAQSSNDTMSSMPSNRGSTSQNYTAATSETGTILKKDIRWTSKIPLNKTYGEFTEAQKAELNKMYESIKPGDEPPFPEQGIRPIFNSIKQAQHVLQARGELDLAVTVGPDGKAIKVEDFSTTRSTQMTELAQQLLMLTKYKPAVCSGQPCTMQFRFQQKLKS